MIVQNCDWIKQEGFVDFKDHSGQMQVALVLAIGKTTVKLRLQGWSSKYDQTVVMGSPKLHPFRTIIRGYTGMKKNPALREHWKYSDATHQQKLQAFDLFLSEFPKKSEFEITQFLRGHHYFYIDFLMTCTYNSVEQIQKVYQYFQKHIQFAKHFLELTTKQRLEQQYSDKKFRMEAKSAYFQGYFEYFDALHMLLGKPQRLGCFSKNNAPLIRQVIGQQENHQKYFGRLLVQNGYIHLFRKFLTAIQQVKAVELPLSLIRSALHLYVVLQDYFPSKQQKKTLAFKLLEIIKAHVVKITPLTVKNDQRQCEQMFTTIKLMFYKYTERDQVYFFIEQSRLNIECTLLLTDSIEKRLRGLHKIRQFFESIIKNQYSLIKMTRQSFQSWMKEKALIKIIFEHNQHSEAIRKGCELMMLFYYEQIIGIKEFLFIWNACKSKHQAVRKNILQMWVQMVSKLRYTDQRQFSTVVLQQHFESQWEKKFLFDFTQKMVKYFEQTTQTSQLLKFCYQIMLKQDVFLAKFARILAFSDQEKSNIVLDYINECFINIQKKQQSVTHLYLVVEILSEFYGKDVYIPENAIKILINQIKITLGEADETTNIGLIFRAIHQILISNENEVELQFEQFLELWNLFSRIQNQETTAIFYNWVVHTESRGQLGIQMKAINTAFEGELKVAIFRKILCDSRKVDYINMSKAEFEIFAEFLVFTNLTAQKITVNDHVSGKRILQVEDSDIEGMRQLWMIFLNCKNEKVIELLAEFIKDLHLNFSRKMPFNLHLSKVENLLQKIDKHIRDGMKKSNQKLIKHSLMLLVKIVNELKEKYTIPAECNYSNTNIKTIITVIDSENNVKRLDAHRGDPFFQIKRQIARAFGLSVDNFTLTLKDKEIHRFLYTMPLFSIYPTQDDYFRIVKLEKSMKNFVFDFIREHIFQNMVELLSNEQVCGEVYSIFQEIPMDYQDKAFMNKFDSNSLKLSEQTIYFNYYYLKLFCTSHLDSLEYKLAHFNKFMSEVSFRVHSELTVSFVRKFLDILMPLVQILPQQDRPKEAQIILNSMLSELNYLNQNKNAITPVAVKLYINYFSMIQSLLPTVNILNYFIESQKLEEMLKMVFVNSNWDAVKLITSKKFKNYLEKIHFTEKDQIKLSHILIENLYPIIVQDREHMTHHNSFFVLTSHLIRALSTESVATLTQGENCLLQKVLLVLHKEGPQTSFQANIFLQGHMLLLNSIYSKMPQLVNHQIAKFLLFECLFYDKQLTKGEKVKCKAVNTLIAALDLLMSMCKHNEEICLMTLKLLNNLQCISHWRDSSNWGVDIKDERKSPTGFVGLENPGCICYLNSFMQQLFMIEPFRNHILNEKIPRKESINYELLDALKLLFLKLQFSEQQSLNPLFFSKTLKNAQNKPIIKVFEQMDIDEFGSILMDKIEAMLPPQANFIRDLFGGVSSNEIISKECSHCSEREESFISISLQVKKSLYESFEALVKGQMLEGQNAYYCQRCDKKVRALKRLSLKKVPERLLISLKRFEFNWEIDAKIKINQYCEFPNHLDLTQYSHYKMHASEQSHQDDEPKTVLPPNYFKYKLKGIAVHTGYSDSGHYYSFIEDKNGKWFEFNDDRVTQFDPKRIPEQAYGGRDGDNVKIKNAYILIYQRQTESTMNHADNSNQDMKMHPQNPLSSIEPQNRKIVQEIVQNNRVLDKFHIVFSEEYYQFIYKMNQMTFSGESEKELQLLRNNLLLSYLLNINIRSKDLNRLLEFTKYVENLLNQQKKLAIDLIKHFQNPSIIAEYFLYCNTRDKCRIVSEVLLRVCTKVQIQANLDEQNKVMIHKDIQVLIKGLLRLIVKDQLNIVEVCYFMRKLAQSCPEVLQYLQEKNVIDVLLDNAASINLSKQEKQRRVADFSCQMEGETLFGQPSESRMNPVNRTSEREAYLLMLLLYKQRQSQKIDEETEFETKFKKFPVTKFTSMLQQSSNSKTMTVMSELFCELAKDTLSIADTLITVLEKALKDMESSKYRVFLILAMKIITSNDTLRDYKIAKVINAFRTALAFNEKYFNETDIMIQWILKMADWCPQFLSALKNSPLLEEAIKICILSKSPSVDTLKKHRNPNCERLKLRLHGIMVSWQLAEYESSSKRKLERLLQIRDSSYSEDRSFPEYMVEQSFVEGAPVHYYHDFIWFQGKVISNQYGYLQIELIQNSDPPIENYYVWDQSERVKLIEQPKLG